MAFKFEQLEVWELALNYLDLIYEITKQLPRSEDYNLNSQIRRAATSITLNIAEGSMGQTNAEQARFLGMAIRSLVETVACQHIISRQQLLKDKTLLSEAYQQAETLSKKLHNFRKAIDPQQKWLREEQVEYTTNNTG
jgi:four helix bundle protein